MISRHARASGEHEYETCVSGDHEHETCVSGEHCHEACVRVAR